MTRVFYHLSTCGGSPNVTSSLTRGWVCCLKLLLVLDSAVILGPEFRGTHDHILMSQIRDSSNLKDQIPVFIFPRNRVAWLYSQALTGFPSRPLLRLAGLQWRYSNPHPLWADPTENKDYNNFFVVTCLFGCRGNVFTEPFPSNRVFWLPNSGLRQTCRSISAS
jgi:hypothetical protein